MSLPVFFPPPEVKLRLPAGERTSVGGLCQEAEISCKVTGPAAERTVLVSPSKTMKVARMPGTFGAVWIAVPGNRKKRALLALGVLAYAIFDYAARESLRGLSKSRPAAGPGRPKVGKALSVVERQRRYRLKNRG